MISIRNSDQCTGCRICELICSFHHRRAFSFRFSSLKVVDEGGGRRALQVPKERGDEILPCDECRGEARPLCVQYCPNGALEQKGGEG